MTVAVPIANPTPTPPPERTWIRDTLALLALILATSLLFALTDLDRTLAAIFYHAGLDDPWPDQQWWLWNLLNHYGPWPGGVLALAAVGVLVAGAVAPRWQRWRPHALAVVLTVVIGPGLLVNVVCKDHWGRPRPRDIVELGGTHAFRPPVIPDFGAAGKAFPCGHSSMGFVFFILFLILRRRHPRAAWGVLGATAAWGGLIGVARMSAGGHFATDVLWSAWIPVAVALVVYHGILRVPAWEERIAAGTAGGPGRINPWLAVAAVVAGVGLLVSLIAATPVVRPLSAGEALPAGNTVGPYRVDIAGGPCELTIDRDAPTEALATLDGSAQGFGFPGARIDAGMRFDPGSPAGTLTVAIARHGWFTELVTRVHLHLHGDGLAEIAVGRQRFLAPAATRFEPITLYLDDQGRVTAPFPPWTRGLPPPG